MATCQLQLAIAAAYLDRGMEEEQKKKERKKVEEEERDRRFGSTGAAAPRNVEISSLGNVDDGFPGSKADYCFCRIVKCTESS